jgi:hypothetical protein
MKYILIILKLIKFMIKGVNLSSLFMSLTPSLVRGEKIAMLVILSITMHQPLRGKARDNNSRNPLPVGHMVL